MNSPFSFVEQAEHHANTLAAPLGVTLPRQHYVRTLGTLRTALAHSCLSRTLEGPIRIFVDGRQKNCSEDSLTIDEATTQALTSLDLPFEFVTLPWELNISVDDFHAAAAHLPHIIQRVKDAGAVVALGSGSLTDLLKHALFTSSPATPLLSIPTALTVTAFTSAFSVLEWNGAKSTKASLCPTEVVWVEPFLACAPQELSRAGFGDLLALFLAQGDWLLAHKFEMTSHYSDITPRLLAPFLHEFTSHANDFSKPQLSGTTTEITAAVLGLAGLGMTLARETTPVSGLEHSVSHALDFLRLTSGRPLLLHGTQVALACTSVSRCWDEILAIPTFDHRRWRTETWPETLSTLRTLFEQAPLFGSEEVHLSIEQRRLKKTALASELRMAQLHFEEEYLHKHERWQQQCSNLREKLQEWPQIRSAIAPLTLRASEVDALIRRAGLPLVPEETHPATTASEFRWALRFAPFVRSRTNLGDFIFWMGADPAWLAGI